MSFVLTFVEDSGKEMGVGGGLGWWWWLGAGSSCMLILCPDNLPGGVSSMLPTHAYVCVRVYVHMNVCVCVQVR